MRKRNLSSYILAALLPFAAINAVNAQEIIGRYTAFIGADDLFNSRGARLTEPWQVIRQDRANFHRFNIFQDGDQWDPFFGNANNRAAMEDMLRRGSISPTAARDILSGGRVIDVTIFGRGNRGDYIEVTVF